MAQLEISHEAAELISRSQATRTVENFPGITSSLSCMVTPSVFLQTVWCRQRWWDTELLKSLCDGTGESRQKARRQLERALMPNEQVTADVKRAF